MVARRGFTTILQQVRKVCIHNPFATRVFYSNFYNIRTDTVFPVLILLFAIYIHRGIRVVGSPLFFRYNPFAMF